MRRKTRIGWKYRTNRNMSETALELQKIYRQRFTRTSAYRNRVWQVLTQSFFNRWVLPGDSVLDLGCGYGEFINNIKARQKFGMDLNPDTPEYLAKDVHYCQQDCSDEWQIEDGKLDAVFTSNFFEHLPDKECLKRTLRQALRCLKPGGRIIAMGPNIKYLPGLYWDFFDHHTILTEQSLSEVLELVGFQMVRVTPRFLPYTLVNGPDYPLLMLRAYLMMPFLWRLKGRQFLVVAKKPD